MMDEAPPIEFECYEDPPHPYYTLEDSDHGRVTPPPSHLFNFNSCGHDGSVTESPSEVQSDDDRKVASADFQSMDLDEGPNLLNWVCHDPIASEIVSGMYLKRYDCGRPSFTQDDDGHAAVPKVESIKKELSFTCDPAAMAKSSLEDESDDEQNADFETMDDDDGPNIINWVSHDPIVSEIVSGMYLKRHGSSRPSFTEDDGGNVIVPKVESIKRELGLQHRRKFKPRFLPQHHEEFDELFGVRFRPRRVEDFDEETNFASIHIQRMPQFKFCDSDDDEP
jgi:hypothetical protein